MLAVNRSIMILSGSCMGIIHNAQYSTAMAQTAIQRHIVDVGSISITTWKSMWVWCDTPEVNLKSSMKWKGNEAHSFEIQETCHIRGHLTGWRLTDVCSNS